MAENSLEQVVSLLRNDLERHKESTADKFRLVDKEMEKTTVKLEKATDKIGILEDDNISLNIRMVAIEKSLKEINENTKWTKRALITALLGGAVSILVTAVIYFVQN